MDFVSIVTFLRDKFMVFGFVATYRTRKRPIDGRNESSNYVSTIGDEI